MHSILKDALSLLGADRKIAYLAAAFRLCLAERIFVPWRQHKI